MKERQQLEKNPKTDRKKKSKVVNKYERKRK